MGPLRQAGSGAAGAVAPTAARSRADRRRTNANKRTWVRDAIVVQGFYRGERQDGALWMRGPGIETAGADGPSGAIFRPGLRLSESSRASRARRAPSRRRST